MQVRPSSPGNKKVVFGLVITQSGDTQGRPVGTLFAISPNFAITACHNIMDDNNQPMNNIGAISKLELHSMNSGFIPLEVIYTSISEDWAVLKPRSNFLFQAFTEMCVDSDKLPDVDSYIGIVDFPAGIINTSSSSRMTIDHLSAKLLHYEREYNDLPVSTDPTFAISTSADIPRDNSDEKIVLVRGGRVRGSCGAPYFTGRGDVFAMHFESINDADEVNSDHSHLSYSKGYVFCRLPEFVNWYNNYFKNAIQK
jgi:hypothetical protein